MSVSWKHWRPGRKFHKSTLPIIILAQYILSFIYLHRWLEPTCQNFIRWFRSTTITLTTSYFTPFILPFFRKVSLWINHFSDKINLFFKHIYYLKWYLTTQHDKKTPNWSQKYFKSKHFIWLFSKLRFLLYG